ncbi:SDR family NAD(P)-dependent oxidoreductase [Mycolicibacterium llatzerense]|uniref:SDR family NAD(P)-dependent oxidoreductase n=1 Tax=Mycolicibacterium llatzerense TaxID=280871 RepID=UPI0021B583AE|nr:SDR family NAD(P)-dependent oxidoreductase [Mycolicibacterium llatzerense]MCT7363529.1 oxidoreductase [Mycolicibacterium llatzerense]
MKNVIITGAGAGIGRETAKLFAAKGSRVIVADNNMPAAKETVEQILTAGGQAVAYRLDVSNEDEWESFGAWMFAHFGAPHVLINNAGVMDLGGFVEMSAAQWQREIDIDLMSVIYGSRVFAQQMIDDGIRGQIVNLSSTAAYFPSKLEPAYGVAKSAVLMASQSLRVELRSKGIGVTAICPGAIRTNLLANGERAGLTAEQQAAWRESAGGMQRYAYTSPQKVARAIERAVRWDSAIVPVAPEAWLLYGLFRLSPSLTREILARASFDRIESVIPMAGKALARLTGK